MSKVSQDGGRGGGVRMLERTSVPLIMIKRFFTKGWRRCSSVSLVNLAVDAVYCVKRLLYTIIVHIQLPLQHLICIIGSLMKLALWNKKIQKHSEMKKVVWHEAVGRENNLM